MKGLKIIRYTALFMGLLTLQSCFVAKNYNREGKLVEDQYFRTDQLPKDSLSMATVSWKELFTDPLLQGYIEEGLNNNIDIRIAIQQIFIAESYLKQGKNGYFPTIDANATYTHQELSSNSQFGGLFTSLDQYQLSAGLSWEADVWGKIRSTERAYDASYLQSVAAHKAVKSRLVANIASTYYQLLSLKEQIRITNETIENRKKSLSTTEALKDAGNVTGAAVKQTEAQLYTAQAIVIDLENQEHLLKNTLSILLGSSMKDIALGELDNQQINTDLKTGVPAQLLDNRPDVIEAEYQLKNAFELTNVAKSNFYPSLTLTASGGLQSLELDNFFSASSLFLNLVGGLAEPIFNHRKIRTQYEISQAQQKQARLHFKYVLLNASKEVSDALYSYQASTQKIEVKKKEYDAYNLSTQYSEQLLENGMANYLEVLTAGEKALNSRLGLINAKYTQLNSIVFLYEALGGGWR